MPLKARIAWGCFVGGCGLLAFFGLFSWPHDSAGVLRLLNTIDGLVFRPAAHTTMFALVIGVALGTIIIPEVWRVLRAHLFPPKPEADIAVGDAFITLFKRSRLACDLVKKGMLTQAVMYESHLTESEKIGGRLRVELSDRLHNALVSGAITAWGRTEGNNPEGKIEAKEWKEIEIDFSPRTLVDSSSWVCAYKRGNDPRGRGIGFVGIRFCKKELFSKFPLRQFSLRRARQVSLGKGFDEIPI
jgi:hypothetical protein